MRKKKQKRYWIDEAIKEPGSFTRSAKAAGKSVSAYAEDVLKKGSKASAKTKRRANLYRTLRKFNQKG